MMPLTAGCAYRIHAVVWVLLGLYALNGFETANFAHVGSALTYDVTHLGSIDGGPSRGCAINEQGWVAGYAEVTGTPYRHATLWRDGEVIELGMLADGDDPANSSVPWAGLSADGTVVGISQTSNPDPRKPIEPAARGPLAQCPNRRSQRPHCGRLRRHPHGCT